MKQEELYESKVKENRTSTTMVHSKTTSPTISTPPNIDDIPSSSTFVPPRVPPLPSFQDPIFSTPENVIYVALRRNEFLLHKEKRNFLDMSDTEISTSIRAIVIDWLVDVSTDYQFHPQTLYLAVNYFERYLSKRAVSREYAQLVGITCLLISSKYEETTPLRVQQCVNITDNAYNRSEVIDMELSILSELSFKLTAATVYNFIWRFLDVIGADDKTFFVSLFFAELSLLKHTLYLNFLPSQVAAAAICLALYTIGNHSSCFFPKRLSLYTKYSYSDLEDCVRQIHLIHAAASAGTLKLRASVGKYAMEKNFGVSLLRAAETIPSARVLGD